MTRYFKFGKEADNTFWLVNAKLVSTSWSVSWIKLKLFRVELDECLRTSALNLINLRKSFQKLCQAFVPAPA